MCVCLLFVFLELVALPDYTSIYLSVCVCVCERLQKRQEEGKFISGHGKCRKVYACLIKQHVRAGGAVKLIDSRKERHAPTSPNITQTHTNKQLHYIWT